MKNYINYILEFLKQNVASEHLTIISNLKDLKNFFAKKLLHFLNFTAFPLTIESFFSLSLSFDQQNLPSDLNQAFQIISDFVASFPHERFYFVIEGSFPQKPNDSRFNIHILFTRTKLPFAHDCRPWNKERKLFCLACKEYYAKLWNKGTISIDQIQSKYWRKKIFKYLTKLTNQAKTREKVKNKSHSLISDYWTRISFSNELALKYAQELVILINNLSSPKKDSFSRQLYKQKHQRDNQARYNLLKLKSKLKKKILTKPNSKLISKWTTKLAEINKLLIT